MTQIDTLIQARWVIPVNKKREVLENHAIAIAGGKIIDILPNSEAQTKYEPLESFSFTDHALIPGFVNSHGHAAMTLFRGLADDLPLMTWLNDHIWPAEAKWVSPEFVADGTRLAIAEMIRCGTTTFSDNYFFVEEVAKVVKEAGIRAQLCFPVMDFPTPWAEHPDHYLEKGMTQYHEHKDHDLVHVVFGPHAPYTVSDEPLIKIAELAKKHNMPIQMHIHETQQEVDDEFKKHGSRPLKRLYDLGLLGPHVQCVHMTALNDEDIAIIKETGATVIHCPESNLKLASGFCPVDKLQKLGITVALGTDGSASNNDLDMMGEMRTAAILAKAVAQDAEALPAYEALALATINGAQAMQLDEKIGSLEIGKLADITAVNFSDIESAPLYDPVSHLVYATSRDQVSDVWVGGKGLMHNRELTTLSRTEILNNAREWNEKIKR